MDCGRERRIVAAVFRLTSRGGRPHTEGMENAPAGLVRPFLENRDVLFGFILALARDREAAEEIFQEVGLAIIEEDRKGVGVERFLPWAFELARRRVAGYFRRSSRARRVEGSEALDEAVAQAFEEHAPDPEGMRRRQERLAECLEGLPPAQRRLVEQRYRDRLPVRRIAGALGWTEGSVKVTLWKARQNLRRCLEAKLGPGEEP